MHGWVPFIWRILIVVLALYVILPGTYAHILFAVSLA